jgi:hypothetical protein
MLKNYATVFIDLCVPETRFPSLRLFLWESQSRITRGNRKAKVKQSRYRPGVAQRVPGS